MTNTMAATTNNIKAENITAKSNSKSITEIKFQATFTGDGCVNRAQDLTCTIRIIAATIGGPIKTERSIDLIMSLKNNHIVCCKKDDKKVRNK